MAKTPAMIITRPRFQKREGPLFNHYTCEACGRVTIAKHEHEGVTPFMIKCRATIGCRNTATSNFYRGPQDENQVPHLTWFDPTDEELDAYVKYMRKPMADDVREHVKLGGLLHREYMP